MTCGIHLHIEKSSKKYKNPHWIETSFRGEFTDIVYGMFAALNNVRNLYDVTPLENRGIPTDLSDETFKAYYDTKVVDNPIDDEHECDEETVEYYRSHYNMTDLAIVEHYGKRYCALISHDPNWCNLKELQKCYNQVFKDKEHDDYCEWLGLVNYMTALEDNGEYETRAVFWFDG